MFNYKDDISDDEEDDETQEDNYRPSYVVVAIDTHQSMFESYHGKLHFRSCLEACLAFADSLVLRSNNRSWCPFSILLSGQQTPLIGFQSNVLDTIKFLKDKLLLTDEALHKEFQIKDELDLASFFLICKKLFHDIKTPFYKRSLLYITNNDDPVRGKDAKFTALNEVKTFTSSKINFQLLPMNDKFDYQIFYNELLFLLGSLRMEEICLDTEGLTEKLVSTIGISHSHRKIKFYLFKNDYRYFIPCIKRKVINRISLQKVMMTKDGQKVKNIQEMSEESPQFEFKTKEKFDNLMLEIEEQHRLLHYSVPVGYTLMYVSQRLMEVGNFYAKPQLLYEESVENSPHFKSLWQQCVDLERVLICVVKEREMSRIRFCEMMPIIINTKIMFLVKDLPFGNEITYPLSEKCPVEDPESNRQKLLTHLTDQMTLTSMYNVTADLGYEKKVAYIRSQLLEEPQEKTVGEVSYNKELINNQLQELVDVINREFNFSDGKKRKVSAPKGPSKKFATEKN